MIKVHKDYDNPPDKLLCKGCLEQIKHAVDIKEGKEYSNHYYRDKDVLEKLETIYHKKCAYCESNPQPSGKLQVEHYRPKAGLKSKNPNESHNGYYWLGNEWSNLLLSCENCNGQDAKGNHFPIAGKRVSDGSPFDAAGNIDSFNRTRLKADSSPLIEEQPLLLNPELDNPENHLKFDLSGQLIGITPRGEATIKICGLNRDLLYERRRAIINECVEKINKLAYAFTEGKEIPLDGPTFKTLLKDIFNKIQSRQKSNAEYSFLGRYMFTEFESCLISQLPPIIQEGVRELFHHFMASEALSTKK